MKTVTRSYHIRAYPNGAQRRMLDCWFGAARWLWNTALELRSAAYRECGLALTGNDVSRWLTQWKRTTGHEWLAEAPATALAQCLRDHDTAFRNFFAHRARYPRFKRKGLPTSLRFQDVGTAWRSGNLTAMPLRQRSIGVDLGSTHLATLSNGEKIPNPRHLRARSRYLRQQQRCLMRRQKGSRRRVYEFDLICIEDLNVRALSRGLHARAMQEVAFGEIRRQLAYKCNWYGKILESVDRWYPSSKTCSVCRHTLDVLRLDDRQWRCPRCGVHHDRDINAARIC